MHIVDLIISLILSGKMEKSRLYDLKIDKKWYLANVKEIISLFGKMPVKNLKKITTYKSNEKITIYSYR